MLICLETKCTNIVICRHNNLLFARSIATETEQLDNEKTLARLVLELIGCRRYFYSMYEKAKIERLIFLPGQIASKEICTKIAKQLEMPAQIGDCLAAVKIENPYKCGLDRRGCRDNWAAAFGLSLSQYP